MFKDKVFRNKFIIATSIAFAGTLILTIILVVLGLKIKNTAQDIINQKIEIASKQQRIEAFALLEKDAVSASKYTSILQNALPTKDELITFNQEVDLLAKKIGVATNFTFGAESGEIQGGVKGLAFQIKITGTLEQILNFFREMEKSRFIINISDIDLNKQGNIFSAGLNGQVYFQSS